MLLNYDTLPGQPLALLQAGRAVTVRWDCGSDQYIVTTQLDGVEQGFDFGEDYYDYLTFRHAEYEAYLARITSLPVLLGDFVAGALGLPSVGEFHMQGGGHIVLEGNTIVLEYQSDATSWDDLPEPADWTPEYFLNPSELAELFPERQEIEVGPPGPAAPQPDLQLAATYTGRAIMFTLS